MVSMAASILFSKGKDRSKGLAPSLFLEVGTGIIFFLPTGLDRLISRRIWLVQPPRPLGRRSNETERPRARKSLLRRACGNVEWFGWELMFPSQACRCRSCSGVRRHVSPVGISRTLLLR